MPKIQLLLLPVLVVLLACGCSTPAERAQKLYKSGEYQQVLERYPNEPIAREARLRMAENLLSQGEYERILADYADTPSAPFAREKLAEALLDSGSFEQVLELYPATTSAVVAREALAERLFDEGKLDDLIASFPNTKAGKSARETLSKQAFERAIEIKSNAERSAALEAILTNPAFAGTDHHVRAQRELARLQGSTKAN